MYSFSPTRLGLGQDETTSISVSDALTSPISLSVSPLMLGGLGLLAVAILLSGTKKAAGAVTRKGRALRKALQA